MNNTAIIFVTDSGFLVPSLVVCRQLLAQGTQHIADIIVYLVDVDENVRLTLQQEFEARGQPVSLIPLLSKSFMPKDNIYFHQNHVNVVSLARLVLNETIPERYENIVYLDGDLQIVDDIKPFLRYRVPEGKIAAGLGALWMEADADGKHNAWTEHYIGGLQNVDPNQYFNAGVLAFRRTTWCDIAPRALKFFFDHSRECERHDQSALNAVCKGQLVEIAPRYNFHSGYSGLYAQAGYKPAIIHFTGPHKPWKYAGPPWGKRFRQSYRDLLRDHPVLAAYLPTPPDVTLVKQIKLYTRELLFILRDLKTISLKRRRFANHLRNAHYPF